MSSSESEPSLAVAVEVKGTIASPVDKSGSSTSSISSSSAVNVQARARAAMSSLRPSSSSSEEVAVLSCSYSSVRGDIRLIEEIRVLGFIERVMKLNFEIEGETRERIYTMPFCSVFCVLYCCTSLRFIYTGSGQVS